MKERLKNIGIQFEEILPRETICRSCFRNVEHIEAKDAIRDSWIKNARCKRRKVQYETISVSVFFHTKGVSTNLLEFVFDRIAQY